jgi:hypothetical protein
MNNREAPECARRDEEDMPISIHEIGRRALTRRTFDGAMRSSIFWAITALTINSKASALSRRKPSCGAMLGVPW